MEALKNHKFPTCFGITISLLRGPRLSRSFLKLPAHSSSIFESKANSKIVALYNLVQLDAEKHESCGILYASTAWWNIQYVQNVHQEEVWWRNSRFICDPDVHQTESLLESSMLFVWLRWRMLYSPFWMRNLFHLLSRPITCLWEIRVLCM
jgi:hypothetical protein